METRAESPSRRAVREMRAAGLSPRQIASALGISTQAVYRHIGLLQPARARSGGETGAQR